MSDKKMSKQQKKKAGPRQDLLSIPRQVPTDSMLLKTSYTAAALASGTSGTISASLGASISSVSEFSVLSSLWREVRLRAWQVEWFWANPYGTTTASGLMVLGTDMRMNSTTYTLPSAYLDVYNIADRRVFAKCTNVKSVFRRKVPKDLEFTNIADDCPTLPVPFAGSPGVVQWFADGLTVSNTYTTQLLITATYELRSRV